MVHSTSDHQTYDTKKKKGRVFTVCTFFLKKKYTQIYFSDLRQKKRAPP